MLLRARIVLPVAGEPIADGAVLIEGGRVAAAGRWADLQPHVTGPVTDVGEVVLLPGFVNAHCHLDYTDLAGCIPPPRSFVDWIKSILSFKSEWGYSDYAASWIRGAGQLLRSGTTTAADIEAVPQLLPEVRDTTPLRVHSFLELINLRGEPSPPETIARALAAAYGFQGGGQCAGLSPHAPYTTTPALLREAARVARARGLRLTTHVAESAEEFEMFLFRRGPMFDWLKSQRDVSDCGQGSPVQLLDSCGLLARDFLAVHVNFLWDGDARLLGARGASVAHCPRSHGYFRHTRFPRAALQQAGVNLCLGTDSLATVRAARGERPVLSMFAEMQALAGNDSGLSATEILRLATVNGARALGLAGQVGELRPGALADVIAVPFHGDPTNAAEAVVNHHGDAAGVMIGGAWSIRPAWLSP
jgi:cytosine/adenosine deaminase-related metal-dependent hydrolase